MGAQKALLELSKSVDKLNCWILATLLCIGAAGAWEAAEEEAALALELWWASSSSSFSFTPAAHTVVRPWGVGLPTQCEETKHTIKGSFSNLSGSPTY